MAASLPYSHAFKELLFALEHDLPGAADLPPLMQDDHWPSFPLFSPAPLGGDAFSRHLAQVLNNLAVSACRCAEQVAAAQLLGDDCTSFLATFCGKVFQDVHAVPPDILHNALDRLACCSFLDALRTRILGPTPRDAREWNFNNDRMRTLPIELWGACFQGLLQLERCDLSRVCSFWRTRVRNLPELWTTLNIRRFNSSCDELIQRSGELLLDLTVALRTASELKHLDSTLKAHANRLSALRLDVFNADYSMTLAARAAFRYPAPKLSSVSFVAGDGEGAAFRLSKTFLLEDAPNLVTAHFDGIPPPAQCAAFRNVTALRLQRNTGDLSCLFNVFPALRELDVSNPHRRAVLPAIPAQSSLTSVTLKVSGPSRWCMEPSELAERRYLCLDHFRAHVLDAVELLIEAVHLAARGDLPSSLAISPNLTVEHATTARDGRRMLFSTKLRRSDDVERILAQRGLPIRALTLPNGICAQIVGNFTLPRLEALTITCGDTIDPYHDAFTLRAPLLRRVAFVAGVNARCYPGRPATRDAFIRHCLGVDRVDMLDVHVDAATHSVGSDEVSPGPVDSSNNNSALLDAVVPMTAASMNDVHLFMLRSIKRSLYNFVALDDGYGM
ncbi:hypothetical protein AURDEDRAFT_161763 [Auricularia subglabra TFB-10046 SS5]|nr:hypothetical protein AURDEDRAFT_161763 [Auricularia subglabra TFB-10046 SS5]